MPAITKVSAYCNGEIAYLSWHVPAMINDCLGFEITRLDPDNEKNGIVLPAWVAFKGQSNEKWLPQNTSVWPVQKLSWKDLTIHHLAGDTDRTPAPKRVQYLVRPVVKYDGKLEEVKPVIEKTYTGNVVRLSYFDAGTKSNVVHVTVQHGDIRATFTNGILATQWLAHAQQQQDFKGIKKEIAEPSSKFRKYLAGEALETLKMLLLRLDNNKKASLKMALYELADSELFKMMMDRKDKLHIVLSNTSATKNVWDGENKKQRADLRDAKADISDRMFNNNNSIGHNKFVVYLENGKPLSVMTGSTNWTSNGLCAQSNNAVVIDSPELAKLYSDYFDSLEKDTKDNFTEPDPLSGPTKNVQGSVLRSRGAKGNAPIKLKDGTEITAWFAPNMPRLRKTSDTAVPPDLTQVYSLMRKAEKAIFFAVFLPGPSNTWEDSDIMSNIIIEAIDIGRKDPSLIVYGAISDPSAMPNFLLPPKGSTDNPPTPTTFDNGKMHIVRAINLHDEKPATKTGAVIPNDLIGNFEEELLSAGHAIIHDKIIVIDPFSANGIVIFGSHNMGFKASYNNDENLLILQNNPAVVQGYALHVLDIFEHYRFRAIQQELTVEGKKSWNGFLNTDSDWLGRAMASGGKGDLADYMTAGG